MLIERELRVGDRIRCQGLECKIAEILFQECYSCNYDPNESYIDIEFKDPRGGYHRWKSYIDGGMYILQRGILSEYFSADDSRYVLPINMPENVTQEVLEYMSYDGCLIAFSTGRKACYGLIMRGSFGRNFSQLMKSDALYEIVQDSMTSVGIKPFLEISLEDYDSNPVAQKAIDKALLDSYTKYLQSGGYLLGLKKVGDYLYFVKVGKDSK